MGKLRSGEELGPARRMVSGARSRLGLPPHSGSHWGWGRKEGLPKAASAPEDPKHPLGVGL